MRGGWGRRLRRSFAGVLFRWSQTEVAGLLDVSRQSVSEWVRAQRLGEDGALAAGKRGRRAGEKTALTASQQAQIAKAIREKNPDQLKLPGLLRTRALVCELMGRRFGIAVVAITRRRFSDDKAESWLSEQSLAIKVRARKLMAGRY